MKAGQNIMDNEILNFTERLIPISDFSKGKTSRIFDDVKNNNTEYIVLKNNQPTAMVISLDSYRELVEKASKMETLLDKIEEIRLFNIASARSEKAEKTKDFEDVISEFGFTKEEIFEAYVNQIYMGDGCYGFEVASRNYFGKPLSEVNLAESAVLAAIIQSPESTNPYKSEEAKNKLLERKNLVLKQMLKLKKISEDEYNEALNYEIVFKKEDDSTKQSSNGAQYTYYVEAVREAVINDLMETLGVERGIAITKLYGKGYKIYTPFECVEPDKSTSLSMFTTPCFPVYVFTVIFAGLPNV